MNSVEDIVQKQLELHASAGKKRHRRFGVVLMVVAVISAGVTVVAASFHTDLAEQVSRAFAAIGFVAFVFSILFLLSPIRNRWFDPMAGGIRAPVGGECAGSDTPMDLGAVGIDVGGEGGGDAG